MPKIKSKDNLPNIGDKLHVHDFGKQLIETGDLDPIYILCDRFEWEDEEHLKRWLIAYWCFYHVGTACWCSEAKSEKKFWNRVVKAAGSKDYYRSPERRHFRGDNAKESVEFLKDRGIKKLFKPLLTNQPLTAKEVIDVVTTWRGFGPWIAFKVADMLQALNMQYVEFNHEIVCIYKEPLKGAKLVLETYGVNDVAQGKTANQAIWESAYSSVLRDIGRKTLAPPQYTRVIDIPEIETVFCKWKSHMNGKYKVGEDIHSMGKALDRYPDCDTAQEMKDVFLSTPQFHLT